MGLLDSINAKNLKSTLATTASQVVQKAGETIKTVTSATNEFVSEQQEASRQKKEAENAKKQREAEIASGYYKDGDQLMVTTTEGMKQWLQDLGKDTTPALMQVLQTQMQVIKYVESPSMTGMLFDNMILCLNKALKLTSDPVQLENIRESFALMMQNYFFMIETNLRCAEKKNSEETTKLLIQSGEMLSNAVTQVAQTIASASPVGGAAVAKVAVMNVFEKPETQNSYIKNVFTWLANKKVLKEKQDLFYKTLEMLFETMDIHAELLGPSILTHGMLRRYRHVLVDHYREIKIQQYIDRGYKIDAKKMEQLSAGLTSAATSLVNPLNTKGAIVGAVQSINAVGGLITDFVNSSKDKGLDINAYCDLQDALDAEYERLKAEYENLEQELNTLKEKQKEVGLFKFAEKKEWQEKIDCKKEEANATYERMQITKNQSVNMRQTFPDSFAMRSDIDAYRNNLKRIEQKFAV